MQVLKYGKHGGKQVPFLCIKVVVLVATCLMTFIIAAIFETADILYNVEWVFVAICLFVLQLPLWIFWLNWWKCWIILASASIIALTGPLHDPVHSVLSCIFS